MTQKVDLPLLRPVCALCAAALLLALGGCTVGPKYQPPSALVPAAFREPPPEGWKEAHPGDAEWRGKWWEIYGDPALNALEEKVSISNQTVLAAEAQFRAAQDAVRAARAALYPTISGGASVANSRSSSTGTSAISKARTAIEFPVVGFSYEADVWGSIRRTLQASAESAQVSAAQLENARLVAQAQLALYYFELHGLDGDVDVYEQTVRSYEEYLQLTRNRVASGVASGADVAQAETQLDTARAVLTDFSVARAQYEHAIATLTGQPPASLQIDRKVLATPPPPIPVVVPSALLERRPDIAASERLVAIQNEQIGIARAALYPTLGLSGSVGFQGSALQNIISLPSRFWSLGASASQTLFDLGRRRTIVQQQQDLFDATVANYREVVLTSFQQVEDGLSTLRILELETGQMKQAVDSASRSLDISTAQYKSGVSTYLTVLTAQAALLQNQRSLSDLMARRLTASVQLVEALGGGWKSSQLPTVESLKARKP